MFIFQEVEAGGHGAGLMVQKLWKQKQWRVGGSILEGSRSELMPPEHSRGSAALPMCSWVPSRWSLGTRSLQGRFSGFLLESNSPPARLTSPSRDYGMLLCYCYCLIFLMEKISFSQMLSISIKLCLQQNPQKGCWNCCAWFSLPCLLPYPSTQLLEELRFGPFRCKWGNLQKYVFWHIGNLASQTNWGFIASVSNCLLKLSGGLRSSPSWEKPALI